MDNELFIGKFKEVDLSEYLKATYDFIKRSSNMMRFVSGFDPDYNTDELPKFFGSALDLINNFDLQQKGNILTSLCDLSDLVFELYQISIEESVVGYINKKGYSLIKPTLAFQKVGEMMKVSEAHLNNLSLLDVIVLQDYKYFIDNEGTPLAVPNEDIYVAQCDYLNKKNNEAELELYKEVDSRKPENDEYV